jgi:phage anti-repressor protein
MTDIRTEVTAIEEKQTENIFEFITSNNLTGISLRKVHEELGIKSRFNDWITKRIKEYEFAENTDFVCLTEKK